MEFRQLECFAAVVEEGTISAAARKLNLSQPPLSAQIRHLEEELGVTLFHRGARQITLTDQGTALYRYAVEILELEKNAAMDISALGSGKHIPVRLGLVSSCRSERLADTMRKFASRNPEASFKLREGNTFQLLELLRKGRIEMAVIREPFTGDDLVRKPVQTDRIAVCGSPELPGMGKWISADPDASRRVKLADFSDMPLILYRRWESIILNEFAKEGAEPNVFCTADDARTCLRWAEEGLGAALVPESICPPAGTADGGLVCLPLSERELATELTLVVKKGRVLSPDTKVLFEMM